MSISRVIPRSLLRPSPFAPSGLPASSRAFGTTALRLKNDNVNDRAPSTAPAHRENQTKKQPNQYVPNTTSTMTKDFPNIGEKPSPPEMLNSVDPNYRPADPYPGRIEHFTGGRQQSGAQKPELGVGEMEGITFKVEPLKRAGEDAATMRARLLCLFALFCVQIGLYRKMPCRKQRRKLRNNIQTKAGNAASWNPTCCSPPSQTSTSRK